LIELLSPENELLVPLVPAVIILDQALHGPLLQITEGSLGYIFLKALQVFLLREGRCCNNWLINLFGLFFFHLGLEWLRGWLEMDTATTCRW
jgi:hypothetical protein